MSREDTEIHRLVDLDRYPLQQLESAAGRNLVQSIQHDLERDGAASLEGFLNPTALRRMVEEAESLAARGFAGPTAVSPYFFNYDLGGPDVPDDHPTRREGKRCLAQVAYDLIPESTLLRRLYESDLVTRLVAAVRGVRRLYRLADRYQSLNISVMEEHGCQQWHFDRGQLVTTLLLQAPEAGGVFEYAPRIRSDADEHFDAVQAVLDGDLSGVRQLELKPGALNLFQGHYSLHRVTPVIGKRRRLQTIFAFADQPDTHGNLKSSILHYGPRVSEIEFARSAEPS
ncbi:MAG: hypothetical protein AAF458_12550 [Pseudomonadota bacterium]